MDEANFPAPAKGAGKPGNLQGVVGFLISQTMNDPGLHSSATQLRTPVLGGSIDTAPPQAPIEIAPMDHIWDKPGDVRGVIMYLPPKHGIRGSLHDQIKDMGDDVFGHPVVIQAIRGTVDTAPVDIFPITSHGKEGPYKPGRPGVPKYKDCMPIPLDPELRRQDTDLSLDLAGDRETLLTPSGVRIEKMYTVPYQSLRYWHDAKSISTSPRLTRQSYGKMVRVAEERARKLKVMRSPNWRANPTASPPEMDSTSDFIENHVMSEPAERNKMSGNWWERGSSALRPRMDSDVETNGSSPLTTASTPTTPDTLTTASTANTPITPMSLPDSCTATPPTIPSSPLPSLDMDVLPNAARSSQRLVYTRAALIRCRGEAIPDTSSKRRPRKSWVKNDIEACQEEDAASKTASMPLWNIFQS